MRVKTRSGIPKVRDSHRSQVEPYDLVMTNFINTVLDFYDKHGRHDLPWRKKITAYKILVSEVMLQQTQVRRVVPKYEQWIKEYPVLKSLRCASLSDVLLLWQGLGYQRRAKSLLQVAQTTLVVPRTFDELLKLPGVGEYTASAVLAFAYNRFSVPVVETNIRTALIESFFKKRKNVTDQELKAALEKLSRIEKIQMIGARDWYYALMDYGAYLKSKSISHNTKVSTYKKQTKFAGSQRELRAKVLFAIIHKQELPDDVRREIVLKELVREGFIKKANSSYQVV